MHRHTVSGMPDFTVTVGRFGAVDEVWLSGELDILTAPQLREVLAGLGRTIVVDASELQFIDAAGLSVLVLAHGRGRMPTRFLSVRGAGGLVRRVIEAAGLGTVLVDATA